MEELKHVLRRFYERVEPLGLAFWSENSSIISFGLPANGLAAAIRSSDGFIQWHLEDQGVSAYVSSFGRSGYLIAQFDFQTAYPPPLSPWLAFARLAGAVARILEASDRDRDLPAAPVAVPRPNPLVPKDHGAEASLDAGDGC